MIGEIGGDGIPRFTTGEVVCETDGPWRHWWSNIESARRGNEWMNGQGAARMGSPTAADRVAMAEAPKTEPSGTNAANGWQKAKDATDALGVSNGLKQELINTAAKSAPAVDGMVYVKGVKALGKITFAASAVVSTGLMIGYYANGGTSSTVLIKTALDIGMSYVGFLGPIGFGISATYFLLDAGGAFRGWGNPNRINSPLESQHAKSR